MATEIETPPAAEVADTPTSADALTALLAAGAPPVPDTPVAVPPATPPAEPEVPAVPKTHQEFAAARVAAKLPKIDELNNRIAELEKQRLEIESARDALAAEKTAKETRIAELESGLSAAERAAREVSERWQKETDPVLNPDEMPDVQPSLKVFDTALHDFIPADLSTESEGPMYTDARSMIPAQWNNIKQGIGWFNTISAIPRENITDESRAAKYHAAISIVAKNMGVSEKHFRTGDLDGQEFQNGFLDERHPVYHHLKGRLPTLTRAWNSLENARKVALEQQTDSLSKVYDTRINRNKGVFKDFGITDSVEEVDARLAKNPDDAIATVVKHLLSDPEKAKAVRESIQAEALANASAVLDIKVNEKDPAKRNALIKANHDRLNKRAVIAPIAQHAINEAAALLKENARLREELKNFKGEADKSEAAGDAGIVGVRNNTTPVPDTIHGFPREMLERRGIPLPT